MLRTVAPVELKDAFAHTRYVPVAGRVSVVSVASVGVSVAPTVDQMNASLGPRGPVAPVAPNAPVPPDDPVAPSGPVAPGDPVAPAGPVAPAVPMAPDDP